MITRIIGLLFLAIFSFWLYSALSDTVRGVVGASRPAAHRVDLADCCLIPPNRGLYGAEQ